MLRKYDPVGDFLAEETIRQHLRAPLRHLASELMEELGYHSDADLKHALARTFDVCTALHIYIPHHFRQVYVYSAAEGLHTDWQLTDLGSYLLLVNGNSRNPRVAHAQLHFLHHKHRQ